MIKLIKYDLKTLNRFTWLIWTAALVCGAVNQLVWHFGGDVLRWLMLPTMVLGILLAIGSIMVTVVISWSEFVRIMFSKRGFLTHTLPISSKKICLAWFLASLVTNALTVAAAMAAFYLCTASDMPYDWLVGAVSQSVNPVLMIFALYLPFTLQMTFISFCGYLGLILGYRRHTGRLAWSLIYGFGIYAVLILVMMGILYLAVGNTLTAMSGQEMLDYGMFVQIKNILLLIAGIYTAVEAGMTWSGSWVMAKGVDLE